MHRAVIERRKQTVEPVDRFLRYPIQLRTRVTDTDEIDFFLYRFYILSFF